ncbi:SDR family oxidoreductase [Streptomyces longwoodensis]|uniref:SDR family oxidoreductase n=1 Tax=Streptomyces longwoodensis TaxID=68231 RepID=UPI0030E02649
MQRYDDRTVPSPRPDAAQADPARPSRPLEGRTALVTGASRGIGRAIAQRLAADGALVAVHYNTNESAAQETADLITKNGGQAFTLHAPLGVPDDAETLFRRYDQALTQLGRPAVLDILVNNAGLNIRGTITDTTPQDFDHLIAVLAKAPLFLVQQALPRLRPHGRIINISSAATRVALPTALAYTMAKAALEGLTHTLAPTLAPRNITVNAITPGYTRTDLNHHRWDTPEKEAVHAAQSPFNRIGDPGDIADIAAFLASDASRWITGQTIDASGGVGL